MSQILITIIMLIIIFLPPIIIMVFFGLIVYNIFVTVNKNKKNIRYSYEPKKKSVNVKDIINKPINIDIELKNTMTSLLNLNLYVSVLFTMMLNSDEISVRFFREKFTNYTEEKIKEVLKEHICRTLKIIIAAADIKNTKNFDEIKEKISQEIKSNPSIYSSTVVIGGFKPVNIQIKEIVPVGDVQSALKAEYCEQAAMIIAQKYNLTSENTEINKNIEKEEVKEAESVEQNMETENETIEELKEKPQTSLTNKPNLFYDKKIDESSYNKEL